VFLALLQAYQATLVCSVRAANAPVAGAEVVVDGRTYRTAEDGEVRISISPGSFTLTVVKDGFVPVTTSAVVGAGQTQSVVVDLQPQPAIEEQVTVSATRTGKRVEDQAMRVEVLDREEIEEKQLMTPG